MKYHRPKTGFTLLEILAAVAIITLIVTAVYGTYRAATQSALKCQARQISCQQGWSLLTQMARQIRCSYIPPGFAVKQNVPSAPAVINNPENHYPLFEGIRDSHQGNLLRLATTSPLMPDADTNLGIYEVAYRLDNNHTLFYQQQLLTPKSASTKNNNCWIATADNIEAIKLEFFDGNRWRDSWSTTRDNKIPQAVKINIVYSNNSNLDSFNTITLIPTTTHRLNAPENTVLKSKNNILPLIKNK